jgi:hypothetical protein
MQTISKLFAEIGFKVNTDGLKEFQGQMKTLSSALKAQILDSRAQAAASKAVEVANKAATAEIKKNIASENQKKAAIQAETAELRKLDLQQRMETRAQRAADAQRERSVFQLKKFLVQVAAVSYALGKLTSQTRQHVLAYRDYLFQTGMPLKNLQQFEAAASKIAPNLSGGQIASELTNLQQNLTNIEFGQGNVFPYQLLGISAATKDATQIVNGLRNAIKNLDNTRAVNLIERMGLSRDWLYILRMSREEFNKINAVMLSPQQVQNTTKMSLAINQLKFSLSNLRDQLVAFFSPAITAASEMFSHIADAISSLVKQTSSIDNFFNTFKFGLIGLMAYIKPITSAIAGLLLLIEDYAVASRGGKSFFGWGFEDAQKRVDGVVEGGKFTAKEIVKSGISLGQALGINKNTSPRMSPLPKELLPPEMQDGSIDFNKTQSFMDFIKSSFSAIRQWGENNIMPPVINNNITMNGYSPMAGGELIGSMNDKQLSSSVMNGTSTQITSLGSA